MSVSALFEKSVKRWCVIAGFLALTKRPGWKVLGILVSLTLVYMSVAALLLPTQAGSWGMSDGVLSVLGGLAIWRLCSMSHARESCVPKHPSLQPRSQTASSPDAPQKGTIHGKSC